MSSNNTDNTDVKVASLEFRTESFGVYVQGERATLSFLAPSPPQVFDLWKLKLELEQIAEAITKLERNELPGGR